MSESTELQRAVENLTTSIRELREELVRKDVYEQAERVRDLQIGELLEQLRELKRDFDKDKERREAELKERNRERRADLRILYGSVAAAVATLIATLYTQTQGVG